MRTIEDRVGQLPERQREALRLYYRRLQVKEIAREMGISSNTIGHYLTEAASALGTDRRSAALRLATYEAAHPESRGRFSVGDEATAGFAVLRPAGAEKPPTLAAIWSALFPLRRGARRNELTIFDRLIPIPFIAVAFAAALALAVWSLHVASQLVGR